MPGQNRLEICGKSLLEWTVQDAVACGEIDTVAVSTDSPEIAASSEFVRTFAMARSAKTATDTATSESVVEDVIGKLGVRADTTIVLLQCTTPIRQPDTLSKALKEYRERGLCCMFSAVDRTGWHWEFNEEDSGMFPWRASYMLDRRWLSQDLVPRVQENGSFWIFGADHIEKHGARLCVCARPYMMHPLDSYDIDEPEDVEIIRQLMPIRRKL